MEQGISTSFTKKTFAENIYDVNGAFFTANVLSSVGVSLKLKFPIIYHLDIGHSSLKMLLEL